MKEFWDERYQDSEFAYGKEPNQFFRECLRRLDLQGDGLFPAEGEGRNAVFAARNGIEAEAFDISEKGAEKARQLARDQNVEITYHVGTLEEIELQKKRYDFIVLIFAHFPPDKRRTYHREFAELLQPGGHLVLEGFEIGHLAYQQANPTVGGPKSMEMLLSENELKADFATLETLQCYTKVQELKEGKFHQGSGLVLRYIGRKV